MDKISESRYLDHTKQKVNIYYTMKQFSVNICEKCFDSLVSEGLLSYYQKILFLYLQSGECVVFSEESRMKSILKRLESKKYILTTDAENMILVKPINLKEEEGEIFICSRF